MTDGTVFCLTDALQCCSSVTSNLIQSQNTFTIQINNTNQDILAPMFYFISSKVSANGEERNAVFPFDI